MAHGAVPIKRIDSNAGAGIAAAGFVVVMILAPLAAVALRAEAGARFGAGDLAALRFTVVQAGLSALFSIALAVPVARALARRRFWGRGALITLLGAPFILPVIVAILGLLAIFGRGGLLNAGFAELGLPAVQIYGLHGVVLAHVFFNLPLATRIILQGWQAIPAEHFRLAASLGFRPRDVFWRIEVPMLRAYLPGAALIVFAICLSSFAVALTLGGGPRATTLELAIYQAFTLDFDLARAAGLGLVQLCLVGIAALGAATVARADGFGRGMDGRVERFDAGGWMQRIADALTVALATLFVAGPVAMILWRGAWGSAQMSADVWASVLAASGHSLVIALLATALTLTLALGLSMARWRWAEGLGLLGVAVSPLVIGTGLFIMINPFFAPAGLALPVTVAVNALMALPFAVRVIAPAVRRAETDFGVLADQLGLTGVARLRLLILPRSRSALGFAAGLSAALAMGDLGVVVLFADPEWATLPLQIYRLMGAYQMQAASGAGVVLLALSLGLFWIFDQRGRRDVDA
ncbi:thiamine/thiamine pyrophosphate ABC transporter permease ThiP [Rhodobacterales bacterium 59_46_T64]|nr:thiamine/thiamine pyrophosphate ABC transporter permease ThiP [Rhodobacterales bacterium 59_46_T64]